LDAGYGKVGEAKGTFYGLRSVVVCNQWVCCMLQRNWSLCCTRL